MNRIIAIAILLLALLAGPLAVADSNSGAGLDWSAFQTIAQKNIFDPTRSGRFSSRSGRLPKPVVIRSFTFHGTADEIAFFTGDGTPRKGYLKVGDLIDGFKVMQITLHHVKLAEPNGNIQVLKEDESMRREEEGPWTKTDQPVPVASAPATTGTGSQDQNTFLGRGPAEPPAAANDILTKLRLKREQEQK